MAKATKVIKVDNKTTAKGKTPKPEQEAPRENRYLRAAKIIIELGEGVDLVELAAAAEMSTATAGHCREAFIGVTTALRNAGKLPKKPTPEKAPVAKEPEPAAA